MIDEPCIHLLRRACLRGIQLEPSSADCAACAYRATSAPAVDPVPVAAATLSDTPPLPQLPLASRRRPLRVRPSATWGQLHTHALRRGPRRLARWLRGYRRRIPCGACVEHDDRWTAANPPPLDGDTAAVFVWTVARHNAVNERLGKPLVTMDDARAIWSH
jgi:hypothetical protein